MEGLKIGNLKFSKFNISLLVMVEELGKGISKSSSLEQEDNKITKLKMVGMILLYV